MVPKVLLLVEQIRPRTAQVDNLRTPISILLQPRAFETVESVRDALSTAYNTLILVITKGAFITDTDECCRAHVAIADGAFTVAFVAETTDGDAGLLAAHY